MSVKNTSVHELLSRLRTYFQESNLTRKYSNEPPPLRAELFNTAQMEQHARALAKAHKISKVHTRDFLIKRLAGNEKILLEVRNLLSDAIKDKAVITPGGEWLLDNFYLIEEQIRTGKRHFPKGYSEGLPNLQNGPSTGLPRVYDIALEIISHSDGRIDGENLAGFIHAYQEVTELELGELWAIPIMLRLALIENLRRVSTRIAIDRINQNLADYWSDQMIKTAENDPKSLILVIADMARSMPPMESSFVAELTRRLMWKGQALTLPLTWMEQRLSESGLTSSELVSTENQKQAADQVSISNSIGSLRMVSAMEWRVFVESMSAVEQTLRSDHDDLYAEMDFSTRDHYRHVIEGIAKHSPNSEKQVADIAVQLAKASAAKNGRKHRYSHVGYYLTDKGVKETQALAKMKLPFFSTIRMKIGKAPLFSYLGSIFVIIVVLSGIAVYNGYQHHISTWLLVVAGVLSILATSQLGITLVNWVTTMMVRPSMLPRMNFSEQIPEEFKTLITVPTLMTSLAGVESLVEDLEIRFLANRAANLYFSLLTDFADAKEETMPADEALVELATRKITELNEKYSPSKDIFFLFHRPRVWNKYDSIWMGYERKRGKLGELNVLLTKGVKDPFSVIVGNLDELKGVKYVITLDTDSQMPRESGWKMIATMAHPLNQPVYDAKKQRVTEGYGILQPRVAISLPRTAGTLYNQMHANDAGIDPYTRLTSDVYQDLFNEGSFIGKGIYDIQTFEEALHDRFPENRILSHDLLEGCYTRCGLLSDVQLYEEYPSKYSADVSRRHRWIRGDWQIGWWFLPVVPTAHKFQKNTLSGLSRWKIFDNLRRSLVPLALTLILLAGWTVLHSPLFYTLSVLAVMIFPAVLSAAWNVLRVPKEVSLRQHVVSTMGGLGASLLQNIYILACMPYEAFFSVDAIVRTSWRMLISHKHLLEWRASNTSDRGKSNDLIDTYREMWISPVIALATSVYLSMHYPVALFINVPLLSLWAVAPAINWRISKAPRKRDNQLSPEQHTFLRRISRKTWAFYEQFVVAGDNWLPPDNYQEDPKEAIAHRTSPTNIGLALLANLAGYDFGYISATEVIERTENTINTLKKMERHRGHFYNWYDTITLAPLLPRYISTVDSGNLAGHLLTLRQGLIALPAEPIFSLKFYEGLQDTADVIAICMPNEVLIQNFKAHLTQALRAPLSLESAKIELDWLVKAADGINEKAKTADNEAPFWGELLKEQCTKLYEHLIALAPWLLLPIEPDAIHAVNIYSKIPTMHDLIELRPMLLADIARRKAGNSSAAENEWLDSLKTVVEASAQKANELILLIEQQDAACNDMADIEYEFLYDRPKHLLTIGYNVDADRRDAGAYDLLASEARLCNFVAIAQDKLPQDSWFSLGRLLTNESGSPILLSWSGSMFEYLMPNLVMPDYENTLLHNTNKAVVERQIEYASQRNVPWGISESGYNMVDASLNYQYRAFGVPGLGLKRGLSDDLVIAPYASMMALMVSPYEACVNLQRMSDDGFEGKYGFYEAIDYTPARIPRGQTSALIESFMVHHQGMGFLALDYLLQDQPMQKRFVAELQFQATLLLLQERIPKGTIPYSHTSDIAEITFPANNTEIRVVGTPNTQVPEIQLLSNGRYNAMVTNSGGGYSRWKNIAVTRWREDSTRDNWGTFCYVRDLETNNFWSNAHQPTIKQAKSYEATFTQGRAEFRRTDNNIETHTDVVISPEDDIELRRIKLTNRSRRRRTLEITSYAEIVLADANADNAHPAFSNLFVQTEIKKQQNAIICTRRPSKDEQVPWMAHLMKAHGVEFDEVSYETDRMRFTGRGNGTDAPDAVTKQKTLSNSDGSVLDPIVSIRYKFTLEPGKTATFDMIIGVCDTQAGILSVVEKYQDQHHMDRVLELAWTHSQVVLRQINATEQDAQLYNRLAGSVIYMNPALRADPMILASNTKGQSSLWSYSISGDLPIVLLRLKEQTNIQLARQLIQAHAYWRLKGLAVDLVIWNEDHGGYRQNLYDQLTGMIATEVGGGFTDKPGGVFIRNAEQVSKEDMVLFQTVARVIISDERGTLADQIGRRNPARTAIAAITQNAPIVTSAPALPVMEDVEFNNGIGGFSKDGREYIINTSRKQTTPAPWSNILANANFGTVLSESGQAYTWIGNAHEQRLTPWNNDPVSDSGGENFYLRDEETGYVWSPVPLPARGDSTYITRHGFGYSIFEHAENGIYSELCVFVDLEKAVKYTTIKMRNDSGNDLKLSITGYVEWVLGELKQKSAMHIVTENDPVTSTLFARNPYNGEFNNKIAFFSVDDGATRTFTCDRTEFMGRNGTYRNPDGMNRVKLSNRAGAGMDACAAIQSYFELADGQEKEISFILGAADNMGVAVNLVKENRGATAAHKALEEVRTYWSKTLGHIQINTPSMALNMLTNGWLMYQTLGCRLWARSGYYQSGGAFGFRDQLQDVIAITYVEPKLAREQILLSASRQFHEGDVQHWWHPPTGRGVRTLCSDDYLWLPFVTAQYLLHTGDNAILDEPVYFLEQRLLNPEEESNYDLPGKSRDTATLYTHCLLSVKHGLRFGVNGLPLMGTGDWNDGMDNVGRHGKGESIWLAFFLYDVLRKFSTIAELKNDAEAVTLCNTEADKLKANINKNGWDGEWYRRGYFDDGTPLGSKQNPECSIDSISQSWSVLSGGGEIDRSKGAMQWVDKRLVDRNNKLIQLLDPPFDKSNMNPGYIKGYVPGVRENGGQYSHAAVWTIMAFAALKEKEKTWELINMINPVNHGSTAADIAVYKVEPYVMAADVYKVSSHLGRGGWTWYTGSAGWMYQAIITSVLGLKLVGNKLSFEPCIPDEWPSFNIQYHYGNTVYDITVTNSNEGDGFVLIDGIASGHEITLNDDGITHNIAIRLGK